MTTESPTRRLKTKAAWILMITALLLFIGLSYMTFPDLIQWYAIEKHPAKTTGRVTGIKAFSEGIGALITYRFDLTEADGSSRSYTKSQNANHNYSMNAEVTIEYAASNPAYSRIEGEDSELLPRLILTGCFMPVAALFLYAGTVIIKSGIKEKRKQSETSLCPYCGAKLRTKAAKQCWQCKQDWHDEALIR